MIATYVLINFLALSETYRADNNDASDEESDLFEDIWREIMAILAGHTFSYVWLFANYRSWKAYQLEALYYSKLSIEEEILNID